jgi:hypothetical protein
MLIENKQKILEMYDNNTLKEISLCSINLNFTDNDSNIIDKFGNIMERDRLEFILDQYSFPREFDLTKDVNIIFHPYIKNLFI